MPSPCKRGSSRSPWSTSQPGHRTTGIPGALPVGAESVPWQVTVPRHGSLRVVTVGVTVPLRVQMVAEGAPTGTHTGYLPHPHRGRLIDLRSQATEKALTLAEVQQNVGHGGTRACPGARQRQGHLAPADHPQRFGISGSIVEGLMARWCFASPSAWGVSPDK